MVPESDHRFDQELAEWFSRRGGAWSGTAGELLASLRSSDNPNTLAPTSSAGLYTHLQCHRQELQSLGIDVLLLNNTVPRKVSLRTLPDQQSQRKPPSNTIAADRKADDVNLPSPVTVRKIYSAPLAASASPAPETAHQQIPPTTSDSTPDSATPRPAFGNGPREGFFVNTGEALVAMLEMRRQIRDQGLDLEATVDLVIRRSQQITRCSAVAVGFLPEEIGSQFRSGAVSSRTELAFDANLFQGSLLAGEAVPISDARNHPVLGAKCRREGIGSLIMMPIFRGQDVAGAIEFFFTEGRSFSAEDVMDLALVAGVISESLGGSRNIGVKRTMWSRRPPATGVSQNSAPHSGLKMHSQPEDSKLPQPDTGRAGIVAEAQSTQPESGSPEVVLDTLATKLGTAPGQVWRILKKTWGG